MLLTRRVVLPKSKRLEHESVKEYGHQKDHVINGVAVLLLNPQDFRWEEGVLDLHLSRFPVPWEEVKLEKVFEHYHGLLHENKIIEEFIKEEMLRISPQCKL